MRQMLLFCLSMFFVTSIAFSQNLRENLDYINDQFAKYNSYNTVFNIDTEYQALVIYDDMGTVVCYFEDVEFDYSEESKNLFEIRCIDDDECIDQKKSNEEEYSSGGIYVVELNGGNLSKVMEKLN